MKRLVFMQANLKMIESMIARESLKELNPSTIDITKVPTLPKRDERIEYYYFLHKSKIVHRDIKLKGQCLW
jgi:hypothetical protein